MENSFHKRVPGGKSQASAWRASMRAPGGSRTQRCLMLPSDHNGYCGVKPTTPGAMRPLPRSAYKPVADSVGGSGSSSTSAAAGAAASNRNDRNDRSSDRITPAPTSRGQGRTAVTSISTRKPGFTSAATCMVERAGRLGCASVPKNWL